MIRGTLVCCILTFLQICKACQIPQFSFTISSLKNETGNWYAEVHLNQDSGSPWDVYVDRTTVKINGKETVAIVAKLIPKQFDGYEEISGLGYYKLHKTYSKWQEAVDSCEEEGAHLVILNSQEEARALDKIIKEESSKYLYHWVGIHDIYVEGQYITVFNQTIQSTGYIKWYNGKPKGEPQYRCVAYICNSQRCGYDDWDCNVGRPFICELNHVP